MDEDPQLHGPADPLSPEDLLNPVETLPFRLGFEEDEALRELHQEVLIAIETARPEAISEAWTRYEAAAEPQVDFPDEGPRNTRARAGLAITKALIYLEAGEDVNYLTELLAAEAAATAGEWADIKPTLDAEFAEYTGSARYIQAQANFEAGCANFESSRRLYDLAIETYIVLEDVSGDPAMRATLSLRMAECYIEILRLDGQQLVDLPEGDTERLQRLAYASVQTAASYLEPGHEMNKVLVMMDELGGYDWWRALEEE